MSNQYFEQLKINIARPTAVKAINDRIISGNRKGWSDFQINLLGAQTYSNVCAPIAAILDYYRLQGNTFRINWHGLEGSYIRHTRFDNPLNVESEINSIELDYPFDKVWKFKSSEGINALVNSSLLTIRQTDIIEEGVLSSIEWCLNEAMDNILQHSGVGCGYMMAQLLKSNKQFSVCIFDVGMGIFNSLKNSKHRPKTRLDAITMAMQEKVTRDESIGQGNGLWGLSKILETGQGYLQISSSGAMYCRERDGKITTIENGTFNLGRKNGTTLIDFQLNYGNPVNIAEVLTGYDSVDLWLENLEDDNGDVVLKIAEQAGGTGTRLSAEKLRNLILNLVLVDNKKVILDFSGINLVSSSFADELIGKIIAQYGFVFFTKKFEIINLTPLNISVLNRSVQQRMAQLYYDSHLDDLFED